MSEKSAIIEFLRTIPDPRLDRGKKYSRESRKKRMIYKTIMNIPKTLFITMITPDGIWENDHSKRLITDQVVLNDLFQE